MRMRITLIGMFLTCSTLLGWSQEIKRDSVYSDFTQTFLEELSDTTDVITTNVNKKSNWFVSVAGGINCLHAEANRLVNSWYDRLHPAFQVSVGKWINPAFGLRIQLGTGRLSGYYYPFFFYNLFYQLHDHTIIPQEALPYITKDGQWFHRKFNYFEANFCFMTDAVRWFRHEESRWGVYLMAGPGFAHSMKNQGILANNSFAFKGALQVNYQFHKHWDVFAEFHGTIVDESFDGQIGGYDGKINRTLEGFAGLSIGVSYRFGEKKFERYTRMNPIVHETALRTITQTKLTPLAQHPVEKIEPLMVRFFIDQHNIEPDQELGIERIAHYLHEHPDSKVLLSGYADKETAYPAYNLKLSKRRCNSVREYLIEVCDIDPSRININPQGDLSRVYKKSYRWNRVVVMTIVQ